MSNSERLHPALLHQIVNSLGWRDLRPFQDQAIGPILEGQNAIILAPTAGGKTEAVFFPVLSRMLTEAWKGLSVLYICPIKALLNNLDSRLQRYCTLVGRRSALWHGDVKAHDRKKILRDPPDCLLTTPESIEVMLDSPNVDTAALFAGIRVVVIDEIHAFAGDDRGWHLLAVLERLSRFTGHKIQRVGLSATVGNPNDLLTWLTGGAEGVGSVLLPPPADAAPASVELDFVGSLANAALVISRLHRGEKRLVFIDSRARAEQLGSALRELEVTAFVTHSSLSHDQRQQAEVAFASRNNCVIVATSVLELGIDVGDLDRVIQIDAPSRVSSLLQRMGRTGRRVNSERNCLFLATSDEALLQAAGLIDLWREGVVEAVTPPLLPIHVVAQQLMALVLQESGIGRAQWRIEIAGFLETAGLSANLLDELEAWMLKGDILLDDDGVLGFGKTGEKQFGRKNFLELFSVFMSPPLFRVLHGRAELGFVDELSFLAKKNGPRILLLGGRAWKVNHVDWQRKQAYVEEAASKGNSHWVGEGPGLGFKLCQAMKRVLASDEKRVGWSTRACKQIAEIRHEFSWVKLGSTTILSKGIENEWWTFGGNGANASLATALSGVLRSEVVANSLSLTFSEGARPADIQKACMQLKNLDPQRLLPQIDEDALECIKFVESVPKLVAIEMLQRRLHDPHGIIGLLAEPLNIHSES